MLVNNHPFIFLYLVGCGAAVFLILFKGILFWIVGWIIKANILNRNLKKILPPDDRTLVEKAGMIIGSLLVEAALSWINVAVVLWQIPAGLVRTARDVFSSAPEAIKQLRFPLRNNPSMSRESVWAYCLALQVKAGEKSPDAAALLAYLSEMSSDYPDFDRVVALKQLDNLNVIGADIISAALDQLKHPGEEI